MVGKPSMCVGQKKLDLMPLLLMTHFSLTQSLKVTTGLMLRYSLSQNLVITSDIEIHNSAVLVHNLLSTISGYFI